MNGEMTKMEKLLEVLLAAKPVTDAKTLLEAKDLYGEGVFDSLDIIIVVNELNAAYGTSIGAADFTREDFMTPADILMLVERHGGRV
jgi:acyl carrier protein